MLRSALGIVAGLMALGFLTSGAVVLRRRFLPSLSGPPGWLADLVAVVAAIVVASEVLGTVGWFRIAPLTVVLIATGGIVWYLGRSTLRPATDPPDPPVEARNRTGPVGVWVAVGAAALLIAEWVPRLVHVYRAGPLTIDSLWYHLPIAARLAQTGETLPLTFVFAGDSLPSYFPHTSELLHAVGIVFLGHDTLTPVLNLLWLAVALLSAWCIGRAFGVAPLTFTGVAVILCGPQLVMYEAGQGLNDLFGVAFALAAVSMLVHTWRRADFPSGVLYAGLAMGLALSSKMSVVGVAGAMTVALLVVLPRGQRIRLWILWLVGLVVTGSFWFLRNLNAVGTPVAGVNVKIGPFELPTVHVGGLSTVWSKLFSGDRWTADFLPGFRFAMGPVWWAALAIAFGGLLLGLVLPRTDQRIRLIAFVGLASFVVYLFTPQSLGIFGNAAFFRHNVRYMAIPLVFGTTAFTLVVARGSAWVMRATAIVFAVVLVASQLDEDLWPFGSVAPPEFGLPVLSDAELVVGVVAGLCVAGLIAVAWWWASTRTRKPSRSSLVVGVAAVVVIAVGGLLALQHAYLDRRYVNAPFMTKTYRWAQAHGDERIGLAGTFLQYPLTGKQISNHVGYLDDRTGGLQYSEPIADCASWRRAVNRERLGYVVITTPGFPLPVAPTAREKGWTETDPAAELLRTDRMGKSSAWLYRLHGRLDPATCPKPAPTAPPG